MESGSEQERKDRARDVGVINEVTEKNRARVGGVGGGIEGLVRGW